MFSETCNAAMDAAMDVIDRGDDATATVVLRKIRETDFPRELAANVEREIAKDIYSSRKHLTWMRQTAKFPYR